MELFKCRPLALGCAGFILSLFVSFYVSTPIKVLVIAFALISFLSLLAVYLIKKKRSVLDGIIKYAPLCFLIALSMIISIFAFGKMTKAEEYYGEDKEVVATVMDEVYELDYKARYIIKIEKIDEKKVNIDAIFTTSSPTLDLEDSFLVNGRISKIKSDSIGYNEEKAYLDDGIFTSVSGEGVTILQKVSAKESIFKRINNSLTKHYENHLNLDTASMFSSILLGNDRGLDLSIKRDFSRIGISHILALSGMHITLITTLLGLALSLAKIPKPIRSALLILAIFFFVAITGFSESSIRAGLMMCIFFALSIFGEGTDKITTLLLSVALILVFKPYFIFSVSLQLSFLAMLGCLVSVRLVKYMRLHRKIKPKPIRYVAYTIITSLVVMGFTILVVFYNFGYISLLTPISNLVFVPIFTLLIYFAPFLLLVVGIPYVSVPFIFVAEWATDKILWLINLISRLRGIVLPIYSTAQIIGIVLIFSALIIMIVIKRKHLLKVLPAILVGFLVLILGSVSNYIVKKTNDYVVAFNYEISDYVVFENNNRLNIVDISTTTTGNARLPRGLKDGLGYGEIESYVVCDYSHLTDKYLDDILSYMIVRELYVPVPENEDEQLIYDEIVKIAEDENTELKLLQKELMLGEYQLEFNILSLDRSKRKSVSFTATINENVITYFGSASYEAFDYFTEKKAGITDVAIFGEYGPSYKQEYEYTMKYLDCAIFMGDSYYFASQEIKNATQGDLFLLNNDLSRIKLSKP